MSLNLMVYSPCTASPPLPYPPLHCSQSLAITFRGISELIVKDRGRKLWWEGEKKWSFLSYSFPSLPACALLAGLQLSQFSLVPYSPLSLGKTCNRPPSLKQRRLGGGGGRWSATGGMRHLADLWKWYSGRGIKTGPGSENSKDERGWGFGRRLFQIFPL